jgi:uncharacterized membrane protein YdbT with pleckstrin-like domain
MTYLEKNLAPGETLAYLARLHWALFVMPVVVMVLAPVALVLVVTKVHGPAVYAPIALLVIALIWLLSRYVTYVTTEFGVTNQRVVLKKGLVGIETKEIMLSRIEAIQVLQTIPGRIFNFGDVIVTGTGGTNERLAMIAAPQQFRAQVQEQLASMARSG